MYRLLLKVRDAGDGYKRETEGQRLWSLSVCMVEKKKVRMMGK